MKIKSLTLRSLLLAATMLAALTANAQQALVQDIKVKASKMAEPVACTVVLPDGYFDPQAQEDQYPVLYLLHGHGGCNRDWPDKKADLADCATQYSVIIVCPDGKNSWYVDSPVNAQSQYETFVTTDLVQYVDNTYRTLATAAMRAITGLSMGGHGAMLLGLRHPDIWGSCGSMSGGVDICTYPDRWNIKDALGPYDANRERWEANSVVKTVERGLTTTQHITFECGTDDVMTGQNRALHQAMLNAGIQHDYTERPGTHNWDYWTNALDYQLLFFSKAFEQADPQ